MKKRKRILFEVLKQGSRLHSRALGFDSSFIHPYTWLNSIWSQCVVVACKIIMRYDLDECCMSLLIETTVHTWIARIVPSHCGITANKSENQRKRKRKNKWYKQFELKFFGGVEEKKRSYERTHAKLCVCFMCCEYTECSPVIKSSGVYWGVLSSTLYAYRYG